MAPGLPQHAGELDWLVHPPSDAPRLLRERLDALAAAHASGHRLPESTCPRARALWEFWSGVTGPQTVMH